MIDETPAVPSVIRLATPADIAIIEELDRMSSSPTRFIHREMEKYFGSIDPSTHELTLIFLAEIGAAVAGKAELMLPPWAVDSEANAINHAPTPSHHDVDAIDGVVIDHDVDAMNRVSTSTDHDVDAMNRVPTDRGDTSQLPRIGYVKRVIIAPAYRKLGLARQLMLYIIAYARAETSLTAIDLHVWEENLPAIRLYESLGFEMQHRELYFHLPL